MPPGFLWRHIEHLANKAAYCGLIATAENDKMLKIAQLKIFKFELSSSTYFPMIGTAQMSIFCDRGCSLACETKGEKHITDENLPSYLEISFVKSINVDTLRSGA